MKVLIACEYSGTVRNAFTRLGHHAVSCDFLPSDTTGLHYQGDVAELKAARAEIDRLKQAIAAAQRLAEVLNTQRLHAVDYRKVAQGLIGAITEHERIAASHGSSDTAEKNRLYEAARDLERALR